MEELAAAVLPEDDKPELVSETAINDRQLFSEKTVRKEVKMEGAKWMEIRNDRLKGMSYTELGRKYHIDPRTAKRYAESPQRPEYTLSAPKPTKLDAYKQQVDQ